MTSNFCEEKTMDEKVLDFHSQKMVEMKLPYFIREISCPHCLKKLEIASVRNIGLCFNTRNFGDIAVEVFCGGCSRIETLYFREDIKTIQEFCDTILENIPMKSEPLTEDKMYSLGYNNIVQQMMCADKKQEKKDDAV